MATKKKRAPKVIVESDHIVYRFTVKLSGQPARHYAGNTLAGFERDLAAACAPHPHDDPGPGPAEEE